MALSQDAVAAGWQKYTFAAADTSPDTTNMQQVMVEGGAYVVNGSPALGAQAMRITAQFSDAAATGSLVLCLYDLDGDDMIGYWTLTPTVTGIRTGENGSSGNYIATVAMGLNTSTDTFDLNGIGKPGSRLRLYLGCTALSAGSLHVFVCPTRCV